MNTSATPNLNPIPENLIPIIQERDRLLKQLPSLLQADGELTRQILRLASIQLRLDAEDTSNPEQSLRSIIDWLTSLQKLISERNALLQHAYYQLVPEAVPVDDDDDLDDDDLDDDEDDEEDDLDDDDHRRSRRNRRKPYNVGRGQKPVIGWRSRYPVGCADGQGG